MGVVCQTFFANFSRSTIVRRRGALVFRQPRRVFLPRPMLPQTVAGLYFAEFFSIGGIGHRFMLVAASQRGGET